MVSVMVFDCVGGLIKEEVSALEAWEPCGENSVNLVNVCSPCKVSVKAMSRLCDTLLS